MFQTLIDSSSAGRRQMENPSDRMRLLKDLNAALINFHLYSAEHPLTRRYIETAFMDLSDLLRAQKEITLILVDDELVIDQRRLKSDGPHVAQLVRLFKENAVERITFLAGLAPGEFNTFIENLMCPDRHTLPSSQHIRLGKIELKIKQEALFNPEQLSSQQAQSLETIQSIRDVKYEEIKALYHGIQRRQNVDVRGVDDLIKAFMQGFEKALSPIRLLAALKSADEYTFTHVVNVCLLTMSQAESLGFAGQQLYQIGIASALHDVGKLFIPPDIINKPGRLTPGERKVIETHTVTGARYILGLHQIPKLAVLCALEHHMKYNGGGYPVVGAGWQPNVVSQMIAISDVFDAMRSRRSYSEPKPLELIVKVLREESGTTFNPYLVTNFLKLIQAEGPDAGFAGDRHD
jgi:HD-GYP domain-containing protein (c-di-GMP phosphodiesterase class II)